MNAAARHIHQSTIFSGQLGRISLSKTVFLQLILWFILLLSGLGVVYTTNLHRVVVMDLQRASQEAHAYDVQFGQLLLEQASLSGPARVQALASQKLHMMMPANSQMVMLHNS